jgi:hypothetical protein
MQSDPESGSQRVGATTGQIRRRRRKKRRKKEERRRKRKRKMSF